MHTHVQHADGCDEQHGDVAGTDHATDCDFCALYAQFIPREALPVPSFSFRAPVTPLLTLLAQPRPKALCKGLVNGHRSEEHTSELQSLMRISYAVFCLKKKITKDNNKAIKHKHKNKNTKT